MKQEDVGQESVFDNEPTASQPSVDRLAAAKARVRAAQAELVAAKDELHQAESNLDKAIKTVEAARI